VEPGHFPASWLAENPEHADVGDELVASFNGVVVDNGLHLLFTVESDARFIEHWVFFGANVHLTGTNEDVLGPQVRVRGVLESQVAVDSHEFVNGRRIQVEDHVPPWFDVNVLTFCWDGVVGPVRGVVPVSSPVLDRNAFVEFLAASSNASVSNLFDGLLLVGVNGLVLW